MIGWAIEAMLLNNENGKKHLESMDLDYFVEAYGYHTGEELLPVKASEHPDFKCQRADGSIISVELTKVMRDPADTATDVIDKIYERLEKKKGLASERTILVLQCFSCLLSEHRYFLDESLMDNFDSYGFEEIWLADYTGIEAYGDIELFCLCPKERWGYYQRPFPERKPYG